MPSQPIDDEECSAVTDDVFAYLCSLAMDKCSKKADKKRASCGGAAMRKRLLLKNFVTHMISQERRHHRESSMAEDEAAAAEEEGESFSATSAHEEMDVDAQEEEDDDDEESDEEEDDDDDSALAMDASSVAGADYELESLRVSPAYYSQPQADVAYACPPSAAHESAYYYSCSAATGNCLPLPYYCHPGQQQRADTAAAGRPDWEHVPSAATQQQQQQQHRELFDPYPHYPLAKPYAAATALLLPPDPDEQAQPVAFARKSCRVEAGYRCITDLDTHLTLLEGAGSTQHHHPGGGRSPRKRTSPPLFSHRHDDDDDDDDADMAQDVDGADAPHAHPHLHYMIASPKRIKL